MKVLFISTDRNIFSPNSEVAARFKDYGQVLGQVAVVVLTRKVHRCQDFNLTDRVRICATNSQTKIGMLIRAYQIGRRFNNYDRISSQDPFETGLVASLLAWSLKKKWQVQVHTDVFSPYFSDESLLQRGRMLLAKWLIPQADRIRVVSGRIKVSLLTRKLATEDKIDLLPIFVDVHKIQRAEIDFDLRRHYPQFSRIILMVSRLVREKNLDAAIGAVKKIVAKFPGLGLVIVGSGPEESRLRGRLRQELPQNSALLPWTQNVASLYKTADLLLLTSLYEGYGRTLVEAAAVGLPIVSTDVGIAREIGAQIAELSTLPLVLEQALSNPTPKEVGRHSSLDSWEHYLAEFKKNFERL